MSPKEIIDATGLSENSVYTTVRKMLDDGDLAQPEYGLYKAPAGRADAAESDADSSPTDPSPAGQNGAGGDAADASATGEPPRPAASEPVSRKSREPEARDSQARDSKSRPSGSGRSADRDRSGAADRVAVPLVRVGAAAGGRDDPFVPLAPAYATYDRRRIAQETGADPERLVFLAVTGTAMAPTVAAGDRLLVARHDGEALLEGDLYVFRRSGRGVLLRRVFWTADGTLRLIADADDASDLTANPEHAAAWQILGRVVQVHRSV